MQLLKDSSFLNKLQAEVNGWVKEIQKITKLSRDPASGTAIQEINFWLNMETALVDVDEQLRSDPIGTIICRKWQRRRRQRPLLFLL